MEFWDIKYAFGGTWNWEFIVSYLSVLFGVLVIYSKWRQKMWNIKVNQVWFNFPSPPTHSIFFSGWKLKSIQSVKIFEKYPSIIWKISKYISKYTSKYIEKHPKCKDIWKITSIIWKILEYRDANISELFFPRSH